MFSSMKIIKIGIRKKAEIPITSTGDQEEQYFQDLDQQKQSEESLYFEFKRMRISAEKDELVSYKKKKKLQQQGENFMFLYQQNHPIIEETINYKSTKNNSDQQEIQINQDNTISSSDQQIEQFNIVKVDEIDYVNKLSFLKQQACKNGTRFKPKTFKKTKLDNLKIKNKLISK
ncbi:unnamed protein product [Paramecium pentaurelia]|uniref:Uncharacterized protein n=1 Tax=Paramecium pentaurelia TaxID=43138 RepID=A0A8S1W9M0_9CILI|nr:unnamed protein product [Paramecium pentaurelia]